jgi:hypothetical protein
LPAFTVGCNRCVPRTFQNVEDQELSFDLSLGLSQNVAEAAPSS